MCVFVCILPGEVSALLQPRLAPNAQQHGSPYCSRCIFFLSSLLSILEGNARRGAEGEGKGEGEGEAEAEAEAEGVGHSQTMCQTTCLKMGVVMVYTRAHFMVYIMRVGQSQTMCQATCLHESWTKSNYVSGYLSSHGTHISCY